MKISLNLLKKYVEIPEDFEIKKLMHDLTVSTVEVEKIVDLSESFKNIVVGEIVEILPHPNADKLKICKVDICGGDGSCCDIVCGGVNLKVDMKVAVALEGAVVHWHGQSESTVIKNCKIRGILSHGMICASSEIGLSDLFPEIEDGSIMDLSNFPVRVGMPLSSALQLDDVILEIDNKSLTNRPDLWGHYGIAREISTIYKLPLKEIDKFNVDKTVPPLKIKVNDTRKCPRYIGFKCQNFRKIDTPFFVKSTLWKVGIKPINFLVDITNFVMAITGQPVHAFDCDKVEGSINVRCAKVGEKIELLNGREIGLCQDDLLICDDKKPLALAGIMGGTSAAISEQTQNVIFEISNFDASMIRCTSIKHNIRTEASARYEKAIDVQRCDLALFLLTEMIREACGEVNINNFSDICVRADEKNVVSVSLDWLSKRLGKVIPTDEIISILSFLGFQTEISNDVMKVVVPSWRSTGDISRPDDILEEIIRIYGLKKFETLPITTSFENAINQRQIDLERKIKEYLAFRCGMREIFTYPWVETKHQMSLFGTTERMLSLSAPPAPDEHLLATSLLPNLCKSVAGNLRFFHEFMIFEVAQVFFDEKSEFVYDKRESLPVQKNNLAGASVFDYNILTKEFKKMKGILENIPKFTSVSGLTFRKERKPHWADETVWLNIFSGEDNIGDFALLLKRCADDFGIKNKAVFLFEFDLGSLKTLESRSNIYRKYSEFPVIEYDLSVILQKTVKWRDIEETINKGKGSFKFLQEIEFIDEYNGKQVPKNMKSVTIRLSIGSFEKTLTSKEIDKCANSVLAILERNFSAKLRTVDA